MDHRATAIKKKCLECAGGSNKEVTLCHILNCPLWPFRIGLATHSVAYKERMSAAKRNYNPEIEELRKMGVDLDKMFKGIK